MSSLCSEQKLTPEQQKIVEQAKKPDLFARLGLPFGADSKQVRAAYVRLARAIHPDQFGTGSEIKDECDSAMGKFGEAKSILSNPAEREKYLARFQFPAGAEGHRQDYRSKNINLTDNCKQQFSDSIRSAKRWLDYSDQVRTDSVDHDLAKALGSAQRFIRSCTPGQSRTEAAGFVVRELLERPAFATALQSLWQAMDGSESGRSIQNDVLKDGSVRQATITAVRKFAKAGGASLDSAVVIFRAFGSSELESKLKGVLAGTCGEKLRRYGQVMDPQEVGRYTALGLDLDPRCRQAIDSYVADKIKRGAYEDAWKCGMRVVKRHAVPLLLNGKTEAKELLKTAGVGWTTAHDLRMRPDELAQRLSATAASQRISPFATACLVYGVSESARNNSDVKRAARTLAEGLADQGKTDLARAVVDNYKIRRPQLRSDSPLVTKGVVRGFDERLTALVTGRP